MLHDYYIAQYKSNTPLALSTGVIRKGNYLLVDITCYPNVDGVVEATSVRTIAGVTDNKQFIMFTVEIDPNAIEYIMKMESKVESAMISQFKAITCTTGEDAISKEVIGNRIFEDYSADASYNVPPTTKWSFEDEGIVRTDVYTDEEAVNEIEEALKRGDKNIYGLLAGNLHDKDKEEWLKNIHKFNKFDDPEKNNRRDTIVITREKWNRIFDKLIEYIDSM